MEPIYIKELEENSLNELSKKLGLDENRTVNILNVMESYDYVKFDKNNDKYKFNFVGIILAENTVIKCYPKYYKDEISPDDFKQIIDVIRRFNEFYEYDYDNDISNDLSFNLLSLMIFFIEDYYQNGTYTSYKSIHEINGMGEINWDKSINNNIAIIQNKKPYYLDLFTRKKLNDENNFFRLLHEFIITDCCNKLFNANLLELFGFSKIHLSDMSLDDFGEKNFLLYNLEKEMFSEFNSHKHKLLKLMHMYVSQYNSFSDKNFLTLYGTKKFYNVWENVCSEVIGNKLDVKLKNLALPSKLHESFGEGDYELKKIIEKPKWVFYGIKEFKKDTLKPDVITFDLAKNEFLIFDAKYYDVDVTESKLEGQPGIGAILKQYFYQLAYDDFIKLNGFTSVKNAFLFPTAGDTENKGLVKLDMLNTINLVDDSHLENIQVIFVSASKFYELYLNNEKTEFSSLKINILEKFKS